MEPPNPGSEAFHAALGFREVARKIYYALPLEGEPARVGEPENGNRK